MIYYIYIVKYQMKIPMSHDVLSWSPMIPGRITWMPWPMSWPPMPVMCLARTVETVDEWPKRVCLRIKSNHIHVIYCKMVTHTHTYIYTIYIYYIYICIGFASLNPTIFDLHCNHLYPISPISPLHPQSNPKISPLHLYYAPFFLNNRKNNIPIKLHPLYISSQSQCSISPQYPHFISPVKLLVYPQIVSP